MRNPYLPPPLYVLCLDFVDFFEIISYLGKQLWAAPSELDTPWTPLPRLSYVAHTGLAAS